MSLLFIHLRSIHFKINISQFLLAVFLFFWYIYWLCYYSCPISAPSLNSILPTPSLPHSPTIVHVHGPYIQVLWLLHFLHYSYPPPVYFPPIIYATYSLYLSPLLPLPLPCWAPFLWFCSCSSCLLSLLLFLPCWAPFLWFCSCSSCLLSLLLFWF